MRKRLRDKKETERRVGGGCGKRDGKIVKEGERERKSGQASKEARGRVLFYFMFPFLGSFPLQTLAPPCPSSPQGRFGCPCNPSLLSWLSSVAGGGCWCPKPRVLPGSEKRRQKFVWDQSGEYAVPLTTQLNLLSCPSLCLAGVTALKQP